MCIYFLIDNNFPLLTHEKENPDLGNYGNLNSIVNILKKYLLTYF